MTLYLKRIKIVVIKNFDYITYALPISPKYPAPKSDRKYPFLATLGYKDRI
jgi:hypothetical protein